ncbi:MAG: tRNA uridine-5-carboxymethylaminomethyl(34) synthesis GTPase MnmE [Hallerella porci]|uniref:tRNA uridine-5-carboxymethylaminomethyl(34) synthesis GTPase MnmE n=1 Tax=Hallerella TaxID=2815788 RepID=UPI00258352CA|nr:MULTISPECIES: tRNA uridine-5-carboxymethylaminomethyl(34) synthesis GTPase MnmE [Hallerella]MCI5601839.1 tRNA uridine-5-carboxymethylaminomethyl(34) synthesis GTPase MnmE [Hallerella sp.]MDY3921844.1 tRNA uridine-5-carboxymethylaminomethyl(34) synthesis GTPase MnmE [Hallerella porci]
MEQTIVAPATPNRTSALAVIRVSGNESRTILQKMLGVKNAIPRTANLAEMRHPESGKLLDSLVYIFYQSPHSYTGEDSLELFPHGNPLIVRNILQAMCSIQNVRIAYPGEYTKRAFLNGKMDLVQAESVAEVIHSQTLAGVENAHKLLSGKFSSDIHALAHQLKNLYASIELDVDFVEEEADPDVSGWKERFDEIQNRIQNLIAHFKNSGTLNRNPRVVFYGAPNAGKSSLLNALLKENRVLVSNIPGTTRDFIEATLHLSSGDVTLIDTAGIADIPQNELDKRSMEQSESAIESADLSICLVDITSVQTEESQKLLAKARAKKSWIIYSKKDLKENFSETNSADEIFLSAKTGEGLENFCKKLEATLFPQGESSDEYWITSERECAALKEASAGIDRIQILLRENPAAELIAFEMRQVTNALASIIGEISSEDVLQTIFSGFCIGK